MKSISLEELKDKHLGKIGTDKRDDYEYELKMEIISEQIKQLRKEQNLSQKQLGELVGIQKSQISKIENNSKNVTIGTILKVFRALKASINFTINKDDTLNFGMNI
jgi:DNA-binding XRE family transcriptional regulator